jgi:hypothetical protein
MTRTELGIRIDLHQRELKFLESIPVGCSTCKNYSTADRAPRCEKFNAHPPPEVIRDGCDEWVYDEIPF